MGTSPGGEDWRAWWAFHFETFLEIKDAVRAPRATTDSDAFFLGRGEGPSEPASLGPTLEQLEGSVIPALLGVLERERSAPLRSASLIALGKIGTSHPARAAELAGGIAARLSDGNQEVAESAALALGILGHEPSAGLLAHLLADDAAGKKAVGSSRVPERTRAFAAYGLGLIGRRSAREDVRAYAAHALGRALADPRYASHDVPTACILALGIVPVARAAGDAAVPRGSLQALLALFEDRRQDGAVRAHAPIAMARLAWAGGGEGDGEKARLAQALLAAIAPASRERGDLRQGSAIALGILGDADLDPLDEEIRAGLERLAVRGERLERDLALLALGRVSSRPGSGGLRTPVLERGRAFLVKRLERGDSADRPWAALALGVLEHSARAAGEAVSAEVSAALRAALRDSAGGEAGAYCLALGLSGESASAGLVREAYARRLDAEAKGHAALALGLLHDRGAVPFLRGELDRSRYDPALLGSAAIGLALIPDEGALPRLVGLLERAGAQASQASIAVALGRIGDARAVDPLLALLKSRQRTDLARAFAAAALGSVCDQGRLPWNTPYAEDCLWTAAPATLFQPSSGRGILNLF